MKIFNIRGAIFLALLSIGITSCKDDMVDINTNPNIMESTKPEFLFTAATKNYMNAERVHLTGKYMGVMTYMQYLVPSSGSAAETYIAPNQTAGSGPGTLFYSDYFSWRGRDLRLVIEQIDAIKDESRKETYQHLRAVAQIMEVYSAWTALDVTGAMPYSEAFLAKKDILYPKYDYAWDLYKIFDKILKDQVAKLSSPLLQTQCNFSSQDFFYKGNSSKWIKFGNALRIKIAQRFEKRDPNNLEDVLADVFKQSNGIMSSNEDGCLYTHPSDHNDNVDDINAIWKNYSAGSALVSYLKSNNDPRLGLMIRQNGFDPESKDYKRIVAALPNAFDNPLYKERYFGMPASPHAKYNTLEFGEWVKNGNVEFKFKEKDKDGKDVDVAINLRLVSQLQGRLFVKNGGYKKEESSNEAWIETNKLRMRTPVLTYSDFCFMMAEIAEKKSASYNGKDAKGWYEEGVRSSLNYYQQLAEETYVPYVIANKMTGAIVDAYLAQPNIAYTGNQQEKLEKIYSQAWVNFLKHPEEAWGMWKRTGCPKFQGSQANGAAYLDKLYNLGKTQELTLPRRERFSRHSINTKEWEIAYKAMKSKDSDYGFDENDASGRVWWDKK